MLSSRVFFGDGRGGDPLGGGGYVPFGFSSIESAGLVIRDLGSVSLQPTVGQASRIVAGGWVEPVATVELNCPYRVISEVWLRHARDASIFDEDGSFLIGVPIGGGRPEARWARVVISDVFDMTKLVNGQHEIEFVSRSVDGNSICAVSPEESDYWVVVETAPYARIAADDRMGEMNAEFLFLVVGGKSLGEIMTHMEVIGTPIVSRIQLMRFLREGCGVPTSRSQVLRSAMNHLCEPMVSEAELERIWHELVAQRIHERWS